jgi:tRNA pseudouridine38-40 synthase
LLRDLTIVPGDDGDRQRLKIILAYNGQEFSGSQRQPGKRTIQEALETALATLAGKPVQVTLAGLTDAGVHALGQVASCLDPRPDLDSGSFGAALNFHLPDDIGVQKVERVAKDFDPRRSARWRHYRYGIWIGNRQPVFAPTRLQLIGPLNVMRMLHGAKRFEGEHDFASFSGLGKGVPGAQLIGPRGTVRRIILASAQGRMDADHYGQAIDIDIVGDAFLPGQVRSMVGSLIDIGRGKLQPDWIDELLEVADRRKGPKAVSPRGLTLVAVGYDEWDPDRVLR